MKPEALPQIDDFVVIKNQAKINDKIFSYLRNEVGQIKKIQNWKLDGKNKIVCQVFFKLPYTKDSYNCWQDVNDLYIFKTEKQAKIFIKTIN